MLNIVNITPQQFESFLKEESKMISVDGEFKDDQVFGLQEESGQRRMLYAKVVEQITLQKTTHKLKWFFIPKKIVSTISVLGFELTGVIKIDNKDIPMSTPMKTEIYHNVDNSNIVYVKDFFPEIHLQNKQGKTLNIIKFDSVKLNDGRDNIESIMHSRDDNMPSYVLK